MHMTRSLLLFTWCACTLMMLSLPALAQQPHPSIELTPEQMQLNNEASTALNAYPPDTVTAIAKLNEALQLGPAADILYMSLGRAYQYEDQCASAEETFNLAIESPHIPQIPHDVILKKIERYRSEMGELCSGDVIFICQDLNAKFVVDGTTLVCNQTGSFKPGSYEVTVKRSGVVVNEMNILIQGMESQSVTLTDTLDVQGPPAPPKPGKPLIFGGAGLTVLGVGLMGAGLGTALGLNNDLSNGSLTFPESERVRTRRNILYVSGGVVTGLGIAGIITGIMLNEKAAEGRASRWTPSLHIDAQGAQASFSVEF